MIILNFVQTDEYLGRGDYIALIPWSYSCMLTSGRLDGYRLRSLGACDAKVVEGARNTDEDRIEGR
jgi:hypothetical protein